MKSKASQFLDKLNAEYFRLHKAYEVNFWVSYMGDHSVDAKKDAAMVKKDAFRTDPQYTEKIKELLKSANKKEKIRLNYWLRFFDAYQSPAEALPIKNKITELESALLKKRADRKEGYIDPYTNEFVTASELKMSSMVATHADEKIRKACFDAREKLATDFINEYIEIVGLRNEYARILGYEDYYAFKVEREDGMTKRELFGIFEDIYEKTKYAKDDIAKLEETMPGLRKPWNFNYMMSGDFTKEEDQFFQFDEALMRWGRSFAALGVDFRGSKLQLDLMDRKGKWNNGFCHWPEPVFYEKGKRKPGSSNFTCNVVYGQPGTGFQGMHTLFHEGGHAAHFLNVDIADVAMTQESSPMSMAWAETHSMFMDSMFGSIEWRNRYAINEKGEPYSFDLFERKMRKLHALRPLGLSGIIFVSNYERDIYEAETLTPETVMDIARKNFLKYFARSEASLYALNVPHIYNSESSGSYHGYGLADLAVEQWRDYFYAKYGYIVDNPKVGKEMRKVWSLGSTKTFNEFVVLATGKKLSAHSILKDMTAPVETLLKRGKARIARMEKVKQFTKPVKLNAHIKMVDGKKTIASNTKSFEDMALKYKKWLRNSS